MISFIPKHILTFLVSIIAACLLGSCQLPLPTSGAAPTDQTLTPVSTARMSMTAGLDSLNSYRVSYSSSIQGTLDGKPYQARELITRSLVAGPASEDSTVDAIMPDGKASYLHFIQIGDAQYFQHAKGAACDGAATSQPTGVIGNPAALLPLVTVAQKNGSETVNGIMAAHYRIDGKAIGLLSGNAAGEMWVAEQGDYVVKYTLEIQPPTNPTGQGLEARQTFNYELTAVNQLASIDLPAPCVPILTTIPAMPDATDVDRRSAFMSYTTSSDEAGVSEFYNRELTALGWLADGYPTQAQNTALTYTKNPSSVAILVAPSTGGLTVYVQMFDQAAARVLSTAPAASDTPVSTAEIAQAVSSTPTVLLSTAAFASPTPGLTPTASATLTASEGTPTTGPFPGLPEDVPAYPGATQIQPLNGLGVSFQTADSLDRVVAYYYNRLTNTRWKLMSNNHSDAITVLTWQAGETRVILTVQTQADHTQVSIVSSTN